MKPTVSVVIPTHKRPNILQRCLDHLEAQTVAENIEVIVVSDGHDDATEELFQFHSWNIPIVFVEIEKSQQGAARNRGVMEASGEIVLIIGDDIYLEPSCIAMHLKAHEKMKKEARTSAVLGFTTWDPACGITPVMQWLEASGWQFGYPMIHQHRKNFIPKEIQHSFTYTCNISVPTVVARKYPFLQNLAHYGWEDIVWGKHLRDAGIALYYEPDAKALHHHHIELEDSLKRMEVLGASVRHIHALHPDLALQPTGLKLLLYHCAALLPTMAGKHRKAFLQGLG
jgi:glycosyltransferase involved in cell wall biosynthesis